MTATRRKALCICAAMLASAAGAHVLRPTVHIADQRDGVPLDNVFPKDFGDWRIDTDMPVILPSPEVQEKLDKIYNQTLSRTYRNRLSGERVMLSVAYGGDQSDGMNAHLPEHCYPSQGFELLSRRADRLDAGGSAMPVRRLVTRMGTRTEPLTYWVVIGERVTIGKTEQKIAQMRYGLRGEIPDGMLVRVSSISAQPEEAFKLQDRFVHDLHEATRPDMVVRVFGHPG